jgi:predicted RNA-binding Zn-ribbon protein involved in translation (DUF1610 family)
MTTVRAQCPTCGDVKLQIHDLTVRICTDEVTPAAYRFQCPVCDQTVSRAASARIIDLLVSAGALHELWTRPAEIDARPSGPPLTPDDLLDLHVLLAEDNWFDDLTALVRRTTPE